MQVAPNFFGGLVVLFFAAASIVLICFVLFFVRFFLKPTNPTRKRVDEAYLWLKQNPKRFYSGIQTFALIAIALTFTLLTIFYS